MDVYYVGKLEYMSMILYIVFILSRSYFPFYPFILSIFTPRLENRDSICDLSQFLPILQSSNCLRFLGKYYTRRNRLKHVYNGIQPVRITIGSHSPPCEESYYDSQTHHGKQCTQNDR
jgi:hypothetical protein